MNCLLFFVFAQIQVEWQKPIDLNISETMINQLEVTENNIALLNEKAQTVVLLDKSGKKLQTLGTEANPVIAPLSLTWMSASKKLYVYDAGKTGFSTWDEKGTFLEYRGGDYEMFFQVGRLLPFGQGYVAPISPGEDHLTLGLFDNDLKLVKKDYSLVNDDLSKLPPDFSKTYVIATQTANGKTIFMAVQRFAKRVSVFDENLKFMNTYYMSVSGWKDVNWKKVHKFATNPKKLAALEETYSEVVAMESVTDDIFVVGVRNLDGPRNYTYQCYNAKSGMPLGSSFESPYLLISSNQGTLYFSDPVLGSMKIFPCKVIRNDI